MTRRAIPGHINTDNGEDLPTNNAASSQDLPLSQSQTSRRRETLSDEQKFTIQKIVLLHCPRVTDRHAKQFGMFTTPEADAEIAAFHADVPYLKMAIEIIKAAAEGGFDAAKGQTHART